MKTYMGSPPDKGGGKRKRKKNPSINPGQPAGKGQGEKTLVLTLGSPPEKGEKQKQKENPGINPGQSAEKGRKKKNQHRFRHRKFLWPVPPQKTLPECRRTDGRMHTQFVIIYKIVGTRDLWDTVKSSGFFKPRETHTKAQSS
jgi:hypothetical protein